MFLRRYRDAAGTTLVGVETSQGDLRALEVGDIHDLLALPLADIHTLVDRVLESGTVVDAVDVLPPVSGRTEVWASGVTYERSREARVEESAVADVYTIVYDAERPELFFKSVAWRAVSDGHEIGIRADSELNVPEPEIAVVANAFGEIVGYTVCNDVSSRTIEGQNPLYLPQAKVYGGACALLSRVRLASTIEDPSALAISCVITREGVVVWNASTSTSKMRRSFSELLGWAFRGDHYPHGMVLSTGTGIVPEMDFTLADGDVVAITIEEIGTLSNTVRIGKDRFAPGLLPNA